MLVAGAGISGLAAAAALLALGADVTVTDAAPARLTDLPDGARAGSDPDAVPPGTALVVTARAAGPTTPSSRRPPRPASRSWASRSWPGGSVRRRNGRRRGWW